VARRRADYDRDVAPLTPYLRRLLVFLSIASFFEGFDYFALAQLLPDIRASFGLLPGQGGALVGFINIGMVLAYFLARKADSWGRRRTLALTIAGYTVSSLLSGVAINVYAFAAAQLLARVFLTAEVAVTMVFAAEEYPAERRGLVIGVVQACSTLGAIVCAGVVPLILKLPWGWRGVFLVGAVPLCLVALARRSLKETRRFAELAAARPPSAPAPDLFRVLRTAHRGRLLLLAGIWFLTMFCTQSALLFWKEFAVGERAFSAQQVGSCLTVAALLAMPLVFAVGKLLDTIGRRSGAAIVFLLTIAGVIAAYTLDTPVALTASLVLGIAGTTAMLSVLHTFTTELFPTELRGDAYAWSNSLVGRSAAIVSPLGVGLLVAHLGFGVAVALTALGPLLALILILTALPETRGKELEETAALSSP
jgi:putative MFS transporter